MSGAVGARHWADRWERQQARYAAAREARFAAMVAVIEHATAGVARPLVVDLGCGPGSLAQRIHDRVPRAELVAVDADPFLLELGRAARPDVARYVQATFGADGWLDALELDRTPDVFATSTTLHYLPPSQLAGLYRQLAQRLGPGGLLVDGDHVPPRDPVVAELADPVGRTTAVAGETNGPSGEADDWRSWWAGVADDPDLGPLLAATGNRGPAVDGDHSTSEEQHVELLRAAGFSAAGTVWRSGPSAVIVGVV